LVVPRLPRPVITFPPPHSRYPLPYQVSPPEGDGRVGLEVGVGLLLKAVALNTLRDSGVARA